MEGGNVNESVKHKVCDIISKSAKLNDEKKATLCDTTNLKNDLGLDSIDSVEVIMELEESFNIEIPDEEAEKFVTLFDIVNYIESKKES